MEPAANTGALPSETPTVPVLREFGPFVAECTKRGIGRSSAYVLLANGHLETFLIGTKRYVYVDSVLSLPARLEQVAA